MSYKIGRADKIIIRGFLLSGNHWLYQKQLYDVCEKTLGKVSEKTLGKQIPKLVDASVLEWSSRYAKRTGWRQSYRLSEDSKWYYHRLKCLNPEERAEFMQFAYGKWLHDEHNKLENHQDYEIEVAEITPFMNKLIDQIIEEKGITKDQDFEGSVIEDIVDSVYQMVTTINTSLQKSLPR